MWVYVCVIFRHWVRSGHVHVCFLKSMLKLQESPIMYLLSFSCARDGQEIGKSGCNVFNPPPFSSTYLLSFSCARLDSPLCCRFNRLRRRVSVEWTRGRPIGSGTRPSPSPGPGASPCPGVSPCPDASPGPDPSPGPGPSPGPDANKEASSTRNPPCVTGNSATPTNARAPSSPMALLHSNTRNNRSLLSV